jgi:hypothetical protein
LFLDEKLRGAPERFRQHLVCNESAKAEFSLRTRQDNGTVGVGEALTICCWRAAKIVEPRFGLPSDRSADARPNVKRPRGQSLDSALDAVDAAAEGVKLTIRLEALASCQIFAQLANLIVLVPLVDPFLAPGNLVTQFVKKRSDRLNGDLSPSGLSADLRHR